MGRNRPAIITPDLGETFVLELSNGALTNIKGQQAAKPDLTLTINRSDLDTVIIGRATFAEQIKGGKAQLVGDPTAFKKIMGMLDTFDPAFEILPGTKAPRSEDK